MFLKAATYSILTMMAFTGCREFTPMPDAVMYGSVDAERWNEIWPLTLTFEGDTVPASLIGKQPETFLLVRYNLSAPRSVRLAFSYDTSDSEETTDTLSFSLFNAENYPSGTGSYGIYETSVSLGNTIKPSDGMAFRMWPVGPSEGITDIAVIMKQSK